MYLRLPDVEFIRYAIHKQPSLRLLTLRLLRSLDAVSFMKATWCLQQCQSAVSLPPELSLHIYRYLTQGALSTAEMTRLLAIAPFAIKKDHLTPNPATSTSASKKSFNVRHLNVRRVYNSVIRDSMTCDMLVLPEMSEHTDDEAER